MIVKYNFSKSCEETLDILETCLRINSEINMMCCTKTTSLVASICGDKITYVCNLTKGEDDIITMTLENNNKLVAETRMDVNTEQKCLDIITDRVKAFNEYWDEYMQ